MRPLSAVELLDAWERSSCEPPFRRAVTLLAAACPDFSKDDVAALDIGERDRRLLTLREWTFGSQLASVVHCSDCNERLEWTIDVADLRVSKLPELTAEMSLEMGRYSARFRLPNSLDLEAIGDCDDIGTARGLLLNRCVLGTSRDGQEISGEELPVEVADAIVERMAQVDPQADMKLDQVCPLCGHRWQTLFDIEAFFWSEINAWAQRLLTEVHVIASVYGWGEAEILNLSSWRRQHYLDLVTG